MLKLTRNSIHLLRQKRVPQPEYSVGVFKIECFKDKPVTAHSIKKFRHFVRLRSAHYPVQYICRVWPFRYLLLKMRIPVLIPRFESEYTIQILTQKIKQKYEENQVKQLKFVQYGCGTGALGLSLAKQLGMAGTMVDISPKCVQLTRHNLNSNSLDASRVKIVQGDMCQLLHLMQQADVVVSNPPYLSAQHYETQLQPQIKLFEDRRALVAEQDGLKFIRVLVQSWLNRSKPGIMILQFDGRDLTQELPEAEPHVVNDQYNKRRFILMQK